MRYISYKLVLFVLLIIVFTPSHAIEKRPRDHYKNHDSANGEDTITAKSPLDFELPEGFSIPNDEIDEETAIAITKFKFLNSGIYVESMGSDNELDISWDEVKVILYTCYSNYGKEKAYIGVVYFGNGETPSKNELNRKTKEYFELSNEIREHSGKGQIPPEELVRKRDNVFWEQGFHDRPFFHIEFPANINRAISLGYGGGLPRILNTQYGDLGVVETETGDDNAKIVGYMSDGWRSNAVIEAEGKEYCVLTSGNTTGVLDKSEVEALYADGLGHSQEQIEKMREYALKVIYYIQTNPRIKAGTYNGDFRSLENDSDK